MIIIHRRDAEKNRVKTEESLGSPPLHAWRGGRGVRFFVERAATKGCSGGEVLAILLLLIAILPTALNPDADVNGDNLIDVNDLLDVMRNWYHVVPDN